LFYKNAHNSQRLTVIRIEQAKSGKDRAVMLPAAGPLIFALSEASP